MHLIIVMEKWGNSPTLSLHWNRCILSHFSDLASLITLPLFATCNLLFMFQNFSCNFIFSDMSIQIQPNWLNTFLLCVSEEICSFCTSWHVECWIIQIFLYALSLLSCKVMPESSLQPSPIWRLIKTLMTIWGAYCEAKNIFKATKIIGGNK